MDLYTHMSLAIPTNQAVGEVMWYAPQFIQRQLADPCRVQMSVRPRELLVPPPIHSTLSSLFPHGASSPIPPSHGLVSHHQRSLSHDLLSSHGDRLRQYITVTGLRRASGTRSLHGLHKGKSGLQVEPLHFCVEKKKL